MNRGGSLRGYILVRIALMIPMIWVLLTVVFLMMRVAPGDPISATLGGKLSPDELARRQAALGFDRPILLQYVDYLWDVVRFRFGTTITDNQTIGSIIIENGGATLTLTVAALIFALILGLPLGLIAGRFRETVPDAAIRVFAILGYAAPPFFVGLLAQLLFAKNLDWLPASKMASPIVQATAVEHTHILMLDLAIEGNWDGVWDVFRHLILPATTLGLLVMGVFIRLVRVNVGQALGGDFVEAARARGVPERRVVSRHAFRNALVPVVTVMGLQAALLLGGAVLTEQTFSWPGLGSRLLQYLNNRDYIGVQGLITFFALVVVVISLIIDIVNALIDPRVRY
ncbi:MAG TPA: ABC transporter permease [Solirubrobacter sp.]|nr:ABC transporter permease [Solirubrobacter sp.]